MSDKQHIGRYEILTRLGRGMQGTVYKAHDPELDRPVAIKLLHPPEAAFEPAETSEHAAPLEARISSKLKHPNIIPIFDFGYFHGHEFLVFEFVEGETLRQLLGARGQLSIDHVRSLALPIADAIAHAHAADIVHLDLSPRNILVDTDGTPRIMDFGLSRFSTDFVEDSDRISGSLLYMSPEHFTEDPVGPWSDVYALGATFYQLAVGEAPFKGKNVPEIAQKIKHLPANMSRLPDGPVKSEFGEFLECCLIKDYKRRFQNGSEMLTALKRLAARHPVEGSGESTEIHSTVQFLLLRMQRKSDFPTISRVLVSINELTKDGSATSAEKLSQVILRDYSLTNRLLRLVNSAHYSRSKGEVSSVSRAILLLGFDVVRSTANSLAYFSNFQGASANVTLRDSMIKSFLSGLLARHLAQRIRKSDAEEAFICGLFRNLGENLAIYYFPEDYAEINEVTSSRGIDRHSASKRVLGVSYAELGSAVAKIWQLPDSIISSIQATRDDRRPAQDGSNMASLAVFTNDLCSIAQISESAQQMEALERLIEDFGEVLEIDVKFVQKLFGAGYEKLTQNAGILEFDPKKSPFCAAARQCIANLEQYAAAPAAEEEAAGQAG